MSTKTNLKTTRTMAEAEEPTVKNKSLTEKAKGFKEWAFLKFMDDQTASWANSAIECQTTGSIALTNALQQAVATKNETTEGEANWQENVDGIRGFSVPVGFVKTAKKEDGIVQRKLASLMVNSSSTQCRLLLGKFGGTESAPTFSGFAGHVLISDYNEDYPIDNNVSATATLTGNGRCKYFEDATVTEISTFFGLTNI